jgi:hypothetical protein
VFRVEKLCNILYHLSLNEVYTSAERAGICTTTLFVCAQQISSLRTFDKTIMVLNAILPLVNSHLHPEVINLKSAQLLVQWWSRKT